MTMKESGTYQAMRAWDTSLIAQMKEYAIGNDALVKEREIRDVK